MPTTDKEFLIRVRADIQQAVKQMRALTGEMQGQAAAGRKTTESTRGLSAAYGRLAAAAGAYFTVQQAIKALRIGDEYQQIQAQIQLATRETGDYAKVSAELYRISQDNAASLKATVGVYKGVARAAKELQASQSDVLAVTDAIQQAFSLGPGGAAANGAMFQLAQLFSGVVVQAQEFNSLIDGAPVLVDAITRGLGKSKQELREMIGQGQLLVSDVFRAIKQEAPAIAELSAQIPDNLTKAGVRLENSVLRFLGAMDESLGVSRAISRELSAVAGALDRASGAIDPQGEAKVNVLIEQRLAMMKEMRRIEAENARLESAAEPNERTERLLAANRTGIEQLLKKIQQANAELRQLTGNFDDMAQSGAASGKGAADGQSALDDSLAETNTRLAEQINLFRAQVTEIDRARQATADLAASFDAAAAELGAAGPAEDVSGADIQQLLGKSRQALAAGQFERAVRGAEQVRDLITEVADAGGESKYVLSFLLKQAREVGLEASNGLEDQRQSALAKTKTAIADLVEQAKSLQALQIGFDEAAAQAEGQRLRASLQARFSASPLEIPVLLKPVTGGEVGAEELINRLEGKAHGGMIRGPGTGTSDEILARLSNGEFVVRKAAVDFYGPKLLYKMNNLQLPRFASGGMAVPQPVSQPANLPASGRPVNLYLDGQQFQVSASDRTVERMISTFQREALKRGRQI